jgi:hypothetical protein
MSRFSWLGATALTIALSAAMPAAAQTQAQPPAPTQAQTFTDAQIGAFAAASVEIDPISRRLATATPEQRTQGAAQIRAVLQRHNLEADVYNSIAARAQTDTALAARIQAARRPTGAQESPQQQD